jgi:beta-xylosidase
MICLISLLRLVTMTNFNVCEIYKILEKIYAYGWLELVFMNFKWNSVGTGWLQYMKNNLNTWSKIWWHCCVINSFHEFYGNDRDPKFNILYI